VGLAGSVVDGLWLPREGSGPAVCGAAAALDGVTAPVGGAAGTTSGPGRVGGSVAAAGNGGNDRGSATSCGAAGLEGLAIGRATHKCQPRTEAPKSTRVVNPNPSIHGRRRGRSKGGGASDEPVTIGRPVVNCGVSWGVC
jgi:hypothetical protein